jgi:hypothetical protein
VSPTWSGHDVDLEAAAYWAKQIADGLATATIVNAVAAAWRSARATGSNDQAVLSAVLAAHGITALIAAAIAKRLAAIHAEGATIGQQAALAAVGGTRADWSDWQPGAAPENATRDLLTLEMGQDAAARGMAQTRVDALATVLADAARRGETAAGITELIHARLSDPADAYRVALTEIVRAQSAATIAVYQNHGVQRHYWVTDGGNVCALCQENAQSGPVQVGMPFASGDAAPPIHPNDRCALMPDITPQGGSRG